MSWYRVTKLNVKMGDDTCGCHLFSRGGLNGLEIHIGCQIIKLPKNIILDLTKEQEKTNEYDSFLETIPEQIQEVVVLLTSKHFKHDLGHSMYVEFDMCWDTEFNQVGLYNVQLHLVKSLEVLLQSEVYEFVDDVVLRAYFEKIRYYPYTVLEHVMHSKIQKGTKNEERFPEFDWEEMVLEPAELKNSETNNDG